MTVNSTHKQGRHPNKYYDPAVVLQAQIQAVKEVYDECEEIKARIMKPEVLQVDFTRAKPGEKPLPISTRVDAKAMERFLEKTLRYSAASIAGGTNGTLDIRMSVASAVNGVNATDVVRNISYEFLQFMADCYRAVW